VVAGDVFTDDVFAGDVSARDASAGDVGAGAVSAGDVSRGDEAGLPFTVDAPARGEVASRCELVSGGIVAGSAIESAALAGVVPRSSLGVGAATGGTERGVLARLAGG
jgi:hypothetical protein